MIHEETIQRIARDILWIETLEPRNTDSFDFRELSVRCIRHALKTAYEAGFSAGNKSASDLPESFPQPSQRP